MKILLCGAHGQLGNELARSIATMETEIGPVPEAYRGAQVDAVDMDEMDIASERSVSSWFMGHGPYDLVINCAAYTNVDGCEANEATAMAVNGTAVRYLAAASEAGGAKFVHISTDYVFPGTQEEPYVESDATGPISAYGRTKLAGETNALAYCSRAFVVRTSWLYGYVGKNFVKTMLRLGESHGQVTVVDDQFGNPTNANDLAYELLKIALTENYGVYHCTGDGVCSWFDFATAIMAAARPACRVLPCTSEEYAAAHPASAARPAHSALRNRRLEETLGDEMRPWRDALATYLANLPALEG